MARLSNFSSSSKLKDAVFTFLASQVISKDELKVLKEDFQYIDKNGDGKLTKSELMDQYSKTMNEEQAKTLAENVMKEVDVNNNGVVDYIEFVTACMNYKKNLSKSNLSMAFKMFDKNGNGILNTGEIKAILGNDDIDESIWRDLIQEVDINGDGLIDISEFISANLN